MNELSQHVTSGHGPPTTVVSHMPHLSRVSQGRDVIVLATVFPSWPSCCKPLPTSSMFLSDCGRPAAGECCLSAQGMGISLQYKTPRLYSGYPGRPRQERCWTAIYSRADNRSLGPGSLLLCYLRRESQHSAEAAGESRWVRGVRGRAAIG